MPLLKVSSCKKSRENYEIILLAASGNELDLNKTDTDIEDPEYDRGELVSFKFKDKIVIYYHFRLWLTSKRN